MSATLAETWFLLALLAPVAGSLLALHPSPTISEAAARAASVIAWVGAVGLLVSGTAQQWIGYFGVDSVSDLFVFLVASIYALSVWYSRAYLRSVHTPFLTPQRYYALLAAFAFAMILTLTVSDLGLMWIGVEATTVASALLIVLERKPTSVEAAWRYTIIASAGLTIALFGLLLLYRAAGSLNAFALAANPLPATLTLTTAVALALVGYGTKVGLFPMHTWLPDAHSEAPSPVSAMFSGVLLPTALYAFLRVYAVIAAPVPFPLRTLVVVFGLLTAVVAAFLLQRQRSYKRLFAYSSMEVMGLAIVGIGVGGVALYGALLLVVAHAFAKAAAFYTSGNVLRRTGTTDIDRVRSIRERWPWTGGTWIASAVAVTGAPPFGTFVGELLILAGSVAMGLYWVAGIAGAAITLAFLGVNIQVGRMVFGSSDRTYLRQEDPARELWAPLAGLGVALALGLIAIPYLAPAIQAASRFLGGGS